MPLAPDLGDNYHIWIARYGEYKPNFKLAYWQLSLMVRCVVSMAMSISMSSMAIATSMRSSLSDIASKEKETVIIQLFDRKVV